MVENKTYSFENIGLYLFYQDSLFERFNKECPIKHKI